MNEHRIEVIGSALIVRPIQRHRATISFIVRARKAANGHRRLLELREHVIAALRRSGVEESTIVDGGVSIRRSIWSYKQSLTQTLWIETADCEILAKAVSGTEQVFRDAKPAYFSGMEYDFSFDEDEPVYASAEDANELALRAAIQNARGKATILADQSGLVLGTVILISELHRPPRNGGNEHGSTFGDFDAHLRLRGYDANLSDIGTYTRTAPRETTGLLQLHVVFDATRGQE